MELAEIIAAANKTWEKGVSAEALSVVAGIQNKAALLTLFMDARDAENKAAKAASKARRARIRAESAYNKSVGIIPDKAETDDIERDADGIPVLPFE